MAGAFLYGWDETGEEWVRVECNADGKLRIDPTLLLEDSPTDGELEKAPTSNWAFDHDADASAHHAKYTDTESRAAISNIFGADGKADSHIDFDHHQFNNIQSLTFWFRDTAVYISTMFQEISVPDMKMHCQEVGVGYVDLTWS